MLETVKDKTIFPVVERIRGEIRALTYTPLTDAELRQVIADTADAVNNNAIEGLEQTGEEAALEEMLNAERAPVSVREFATRRLIEITQFDGRSLKGKLFTNCPY